MKVLVTDGHLKAALGAVRSLGRRGLEVHTTQNRAGVTLSSQSTYNRSSHVLPPYEDRDFDGQLLALLERERFDYVLLASDGAFRRFSANRAAITQRTRVDLPPPSAVEMVLSKTGLLQFARELGVPTPSTIVLPGPEEAPWIMQQLRFPIVAKTSGRDIYDRIRYLNDEGELRRCLAECRGAEMLHLQEYIEGRGFGFFCFLEDGEPILSQMHERIWEYPTTGGPSVYARTFNDPVLEDLGLRLLRGLRWNGLAMVEFKRSGGDGEYKLMEINPRLWGSLDLSIACGADFPYLAIQQDRRAAAQSMRVRPASYLWLFPDSALFLTARPSQALRFGRALLSPSVTKNIDFRDLRPTLHQIREFLYWLKTLAPSGRLRYPQSRPILAKPR